MRLLRCTWRALLDLGIDPDLGWEPAEALVDNHPLLRAFVSRRRQNPQGPEATHLPITAAPVFNLHSGRWRGLTWHEQTDDLDVVWLLGAGWHESGNKQDAYAILKRRDGEGTLFPDQLDYANIRSRPLTGPQFLETLNAAPQELIARARATPSIAIHESLSGVLDVSLHVERTSEFDAVLEDITLAIYLPPHVSGVLPPHWLGVVVAAFFPAAHASELAFGVPFLGDLYREASRIETVRWSH